MWSNVSDWWSQPFKQDMNAPHWAAFIGLIAVSLVVWGIVLRHIAKAA